MDYGFWQMNCERKDEWNLIVDGKEIACIAKYEDGYECFDCIGNCSIDVGIGNIETAFEIADAYMWDTYKM